MKQDRENWLLIQRYITENARPDERQRVEKWMALSRQNERLVSEIEEIWNKTPNEKFEVDVQYAWEKFEYRNIKRRNKTALFLGYSHWKPGAPAFFLRVAAVLLVVFIAGLFTQHTLTTDQKAFEKNLAFNVLQKLETNRGEKARVTFSDGTKVYLNSASSIRFPQQFRGSKREVYLEGEAYFEVANNADHPFVVYAKDVEVEVLGTEFNVQGWSENESVEVIVREGKVSVASLNTLLDQKFQVILTKGFYTSVKNGEAPSPIKSINTTDYLAWMYGGLHFDNEPFSKVVKDIERRFNVNIKLVDSGLETVPYTGVFRFADLDEVLSIIGATLDYEYRREGSEVLIQ